jgi:hypothetical protein
MSRIGYLIQNHSEVLILKDRNSTIRETRKNNKSKCISVRHIFLLREILHKIKGFCLQLTCDIRKKGSNIRFFVKISQLQSPLIMDARGL